MHEVGLMQQALAAAFEHLETHGGTRILSIRMEVGALSGVVPDSLEFAFEALSPGTPAEGASLVLERREALWYCSRCDKEFGLNPFEVECPGCGSHEIELREGRDFQLVSMEVA